MKNPYNVTIPSHSPIVTEEDVRRGYIVRYFVAKVNQVSEQVHEVDVQTYNRLRNHIYIVSEYINWSIKGPLDNSTVSVYTNSVNEDGMDEVIIPGVITQNSSYVEYVSLKLPAIKKLLTDFKQYYIGT